MKKTIDGIHSFPLEGEAVRFTACLASLLMKLEARPEDAPGLPAATGCGSPAAGCGSPATGRHWALYCYYTLVTGFGLTLFDLSDESHAHWDWSHICNVLLREYDWYIGFALDHAGYAYEEVVFQEEPREPLFQRMRGAIDRGVPVLALFGSTYGWVLITGYDDSGALYGLDGSQGCWGAAYERPAGYDGEGRFFMPDWYERRGHAFFIGERHPSTVGLGDILARAGDILDHFLRRGYYASALRLLGEEARFEALEEEGARRLAGRIEQWLSALMDQRAVTGYAIGQLISQASPPHGAGALQQACALMGHTHGALTDARRALAECSSGGPGLAEGLRQPRLRQRIAQGIAIAQRNDEQAARLLMGLR